MSDQPKRRRQHPGRFRRKPDEVEAMRWTPDDGSMQSVMSWLRDEGQTFKTVGRQLWIAFGDQPGWMIVHPGDWVIRKTKGRRYFYAEGHKRFEEAREVVSGG